MVVTVAQIYYSDDEDEDPQLKRNLQQFYTI